MEHDTEEFKKHIIFPLCALSISIKFKRLLKYLIHYALVGIAKGELHNTLFKAKNYQKELNELIPDKIIEVGADRDIDYDYIYPIDRTRLNYQVIQHHKDIFVAKFEEDARVLMNINFLIDIIEKNALSEKEFRVLCAIYSCLGKHTKVRIIVNDEIRHRALGYKRNYFEFDKELLLSDKVLNRIINKLIQRGFFDRYPDGRKYTYSKIIRGDKLRKLVENKLAKGIIDRHREKNKHNSIRKFKKEFKKKLKIYTNDDLQKIKKNLELENKKIIFSN